jgi:hypothetical protein
VAFPSLRLFVRSLTDQLMKLHSRLDRTRVVDLNTVLVGINLIIMSLILLAHNEMRDHQYLDQRTVLLAVLLSIETHVALFIERRRRDPFVTLLALNTIFFFSLRVFTLALFPYSLVFDRYSYGPTNSNYALVFILIANAALYGGFYAANSKTIQDIKVGTWRATSSGRATFLLLAGIVFAYSSDRFWTADTIPRALNFIVLFASQNIIILLAFAYYLLFRKSISRFMSAALVALIVAEALLHFLYGSRSAVIGIVQNYILVSLAITRTVTVRRKVALSGLLLLPVIGILLIGSFTISSYIRASTRAKGSVFDVSRAFELALESWDQLATQSTLDVVLPPIFARAGYFDFSAEIIANSDRYKAVINVPTYAKSIVDNLLTPGFDLFDQPKVSNSLRFVYDELGVESKKLVAEEYLSDQLGLYGEFYALFNWASIPALFTLAFFFSRVYRGLKGTNPFDLTVKRIVVLYAFGELVNSFGIDWVIIEVVPMVAAIFVYRLFFATKRHPPIRITPRPRTSGFGPPVPIRPHPG